MSILSLKDASLSLKSGPLFENACLEIQPDDRIGLIGLNGSGKSSLLALLVRDIQLDSGELMWSKGFTYSFLPQSVDVPQGATVASFLYSGRASEIEGTPTGEVPVISLENRYKALCRELGFVDMDLPLTMLSGGEKKRSPWHGHLHQVPIFFFWTSPPITSISRLSSGLRLGCWPSRRR